MEEHVEGAGIMERISLGLMAVFLGLAMFAQANDPDPLLWMGIYGVPFVLTLTVCINPQITKCQYWWLTCASVFAILLAILTVHMSTVTDVDKLSWKVVDSEEGREAVGLLIVLAWVFILSVYTHLNTSVSSLLCRCGSLVFAATPVVCWTLYRYYIQPNIDLPEHCSSLV